MKINSEKQVNSILTNQSTDLEYSQSRENLEKKDETSSHQLNDRRQGDRRRSGKSQKYISFDMKNFVHNLDFNAEKKWLKETRVKPNTMAQAYQKTTQIHANWRFPSQFTLKEV